MVKFAALELWSRSGAGSKVGMTVSIYDGAKSLNTDQPVSLIGADGWVSFRAQLKTVAGHNYNIFVKAGDVNGNQVTRSILLRVEKPAKPKPVAKKPPAKKK